MGVDGDTASVIVLCRDSGGDCKMEMQNTCEAGRPPDFFSGRFQDYIVLPLEKAD